MFPSAEREQMRQLKFVGNTVIKRLEQLGYSSLAQLQDADASALTLEISKMIGSTCWHNSPQARAAIQGVVNLANQKTIQARSR
jgi:hypothetical protein